LPKLAILLLIAAAALATGIATAQDSSMRDAHAVSRANRGRASEAPARFRMLLGDRHLGTTADYNPATVAQAFRYRAVASGAVRQAEVYLDAGSRATRLVVGLYSNQRGMPGRLLASGSLSSPRSAAWNEVRLSAGVLRAGRRYWIALLGTGGDLSYRDASHGATSYATGYGLRSMPERFRSQTRWSAGPASVYMFEGRPPRGRPAPRPVGIPPPGTPKGGCLPNPSACGFPSASDTGIAGCPPLHPSSGFIANTPGATYQNLDVSGTVQISAANVTLNCVRITDNDPQGNTGYVLNTEGGTNGLVEHTEINGRAGNQDACIEGSGVTLDYVDVHGCVDGMHVGWDVTVENSYIHDNATAIPSPHIDGLQWIGCSTCADAPANWNDVVEHNTIYPGRGDTYPWTNSAIFVQAANGPISGVRINDNLLDGGGYTVFDVSQNGNPTPANVSFTDNRFGTHYHFGVSQTQDNPAPTWVGNVRDATGRPIAGP
jgi:hypothetical protein